MRHQIVCRAAVAAAVAALAIGCSKSPTGPSGNGGGSTASITDITIGGNLTIAAGSTSQLTATAKKSDGTTQVVTAQATWASSDPAVAKVSSTGLLESVKAGTANITAAFGSQTGRAMAEVSVPQYEVTIVADSVAALSSCDDFFAGPANGEFALRTDVVGPDGASVTVHSTEGYPGNRSDPVYWNVAGGGSRAIGSTKTVTIPGSDLSAVVVIFRATEWDSTTLFGSTVWTPDSRMNDQVAKSQHQWFHGLLTGAGPNELRIGDSDCGIKLRYTITMAKK